MENQLQEEKVKLEDLYLDPNNPRYSDITKKLFSVPIEKVMHESVQKKAYERILDDRFQVNQLKESILNIGFLPIDRLVVMPIKGAQGKYLVTEGNRRLAAIKSLIEDQENGEIDIPEWVHKTLMKLPVLIMNEDDPKRREYLARVFQGVRHLSGIREWGPIQQAQIVVMMLEDGRSLQEISETLGISKRRSNLLRRVYYAMKQMQEDPEYADYYKPKFFSYFDDLLKIPKVREWMGWNDENNKFENIEHIQMFYNWIVGEEENGVLLPPKITDHKEVRFLRKLIDDPKEFRRFYETPNLNIDEAVKWITAVESKIDWRDILRQNFNILNQIPAIDIESATENEKDILKQIIEICNKHLAMIDLIQSKND